MSEDAGFQRYRYMSLEEIREKYPDAFPEITGLIGPSAIAIIEGETIRLSPPNNYDKLEGDDLLNAMIRNGELDPIVFPILSERLARVERPRTTKNGRSRRIDR